LATTIKLTTITKSTYKANKTKTKYNLVISYVFLAVKENKMISVGITIF